MSVYTKGYVFKELDGKALVEIIGNMEGVQIKESDLKPTFKDNDRWMHGDITLNYFGEQIRIFAHINRKDTEYIHQLPTYDDGFDEVKGNIPSFGQEQYVISLLLGQSEKHQQFMQKVLNVLGGVYIPNDCSSTCEYIAGELDQEIRYERLPQLPDFLLRKIVKEIISNEEGNAQDVLTVSYEEIDYLREYARRTI